MPSEFVSTVLKGNLSTWYLLPLIYLNKVSFGQGNFLESYVNSSGTVLTVEIISLDMCHKDCRKSPYLLLAMDGINSPSQLWYKLPSVWRQDFRRFKEGKFSEFSPTAKHRIREYAGLPYQAYYNGTYITDSRIHALDKSPILRKAWEDELGLLPLPADMELMPIPSPRTYREHTHL